MRDSNEHGRRSTYFVICPSVSCDSPNRSDRVFHCFRHCHGEDGRAGQADGGILQHFEWDCNEASDHDHVVSGLVLTSWWWLVRWSWGRQRALEPSQQERVGRREPSKGLSRKTLRKGWKSLFLELSLENGLENYSLWAKSYLPFVLYGPWIKNGFYVFIWLKKRIKRVVLFHDMWKLCEIHIQCP